MKRAVLVSLLALAAMTSHASGQSPVISGPAGTYTSTVTLAAAGPISLSSPFTGPSGVYTITLPAGALITQTGTSITITWGNGPNPTPVPPTPAPSPTLPDGSQPTAPLFVALVTDPIDPAKPSPLAPALESLRTSKTIGTTLQSKNSKWVVADTSTLTLQSWMPEVKAVGTPALLVIATDATNKATAHQVTKAVDEASVAAEITRIRGFK